MKNTENRIKNIASLLKSADRNIKKAYQLLDSMSDEMSTSFDDVPGVLGAFDGTHMVDADGKKYEVNPNYVAKSLLVAGDNLKMVENDKGVQLFKQVSKVDRKRLEGILNKKEGKWYALTDSGSYRLLDVAVDFRRGELKDEVTVLVPENDLNTSYAALEKMAKEDEVVEKEDKKEEKEEKKVTKTKKKVIKKEEKEEKPKKKKTTTTTKAKKEETKEVTKKVTRKKPSLRKRIVKKATIRRKPKAVTAEEVDSLLDVDDLR